MKIAIYLTITLLAIILLLHITEAAFATEDLQKQRYAEQLRKSLWSLEIYSMVENYLADLKFWMLETPKLGLTHDLANRLEESMVQAIAAVKTLLLDYQNDKTCIAIASLQASLENIFNILSTIRDTNLVTQWHLIYNRFEINMKLWRKEYMRDFYHSLDDEVTFLLENHNADKATKMQSLKKWYDQFSRRYYIDVTMGKVLDIRSFLPKSSKRQSDCDYHKIYH
ncbi:uncharacterized protein LOC142224097 [Haematobia irritans]|uniref:uncharacterized protein LOC142224097 n=1 Tax=Haematobia irritans TaxID=7368 RepID=UPI003F4F7B70